MTAIPPTGTRHALPPTLLALACLSALPALLAAPPAAAADDDARVTTLDKLQVKGERAPDYTVKTTAAGTGLDLGLRQIPQSVSVVTQQRIEDQNLQTIGEVLGNVAGVTNRQVDSERNQFYARGFDIDNFQFDGIPTTMEQGWNYSDASMDTALYQRVEIVRGAAGLLTGTGNPSASVNLIRKHADSNTLTGSVTVGGDSFGSTRATVDVTTPLNASGTVRARAVGNYTDRDFNLARYTQEKTLGYAVLDADLGASTRLSVGYDWQRKNADDVTWGGFPVLYADGTRTRWPRTFNAGADWAYWNTTSKRAFASLRQGFDNGWSLRLNATHDRSDGDSKLFYPYYTIYGLDRSSGGGVIPYGGWYIIHRKVEGLDAAADGPFALFGREHQLMFGTSWNRRRYLNTGTYDFNARILLPDYHDWDGSQAPEPNWKALQVSGRGTITQKSGYAAVRWSLADPLSLITGARYTHWTSAGEYNDTRSKTIPYAGLVWDIDPTWSAYASYTGIFNPQTARDAQNRFLAPKLGKSYELGVKAGWFEDALTASLAVYRTAQDNFPVSTGLYNTAGNAISLPADVVSRGYELEVNGRLAAGWNATFGVSRNLMRNAHDDSTPVPYLPTTTLKLFTSYTAQGGPLDGLTVGGGVNWQNRIYNDRVVYVTAPVARSARIDQGAYALLSLFGRYRITQAVAVQLNLDNVLDKRYVTQIASAYGGWGAPRSGTLSLTWAF
ncbi:ferric-rhodotorulic acid/ferric-coprogen receptor FhuE [Pseudoxanthomonas winnipegensis]|uniref:ferric-rhodotorulic acid/ferric-coprogen receptor FhuE n=1 Tax=Pseudoxanthomonas winnipegensis TaxID=2480810 RepID=UPI003F85E84E